MHSRPSAATVGGGFTRADLAIHVLPSLLAVTSTDRTGVPAATGGPEPDSTGSAIMALVIVGSVTGGGLSIRVRSTVSRCRGAAWLMLTGSATSASVA